MTDNERYVLVIDGTEGITTRRGTLDELRADFEAHEPDAYLVPEADYDREGE